MLILGVNAGGGDKDQENEIDKKTEVDLDIALDRHFHIPHGLNLAPHLHKCFWRKKNTANQCKWKYNKLHFKLLGNRQLSLLCLLCVWRESGVSLAAFNMHNLLPERRWNAWPGTGELEEFCQWPMLRNGVERL